MSKDEKFKLNEYGQPVGNAVEVRLDPNLSKSLYGTNVELIAMHEQNLEDVRINELWTLIQSKQNEQNWTYLSYSCFATQAQFIEALKNQFGMKNSIHFLILKDAKFVGWLAWLNNDSANACVEIGNIFFSNVLQQSRASTEVIYLMLKNCFEHGYRRVEWKCDELNQASKNAALRYGFCYEGRFRQHRIVKGRNRDTAWFSMLDTEWKLNQQSFIHWLKPENFDSNGQQLKSLSAFREIF